MKKRSTILLTASVLALGLTGCNAVKGLGEDVKSVGRAGERAID